MNSKKPFFIFTATFFLSTAFTLSVANAWTEEKVEKKLQKNSWDNGHSFFFRVSPFPKLLPNKERERTVFLNCKKYDGYYRYRLATKSYALVYKIEDSSWRKEKNIVITNTIPVGVSTVRAEYEQNRWLTWGRGHSLIEEDAQEIRFRMRYFKKTGLGESMGVYKNYLAYEGDEKLPLYKHYTFLALNDRRYGPEELVHGDPSIYFQPTVLRSFPHSCPKNWEKQLLTEAIASISSYLIERHTDEKKDSAKK